ncbi:hypothetical protein PsorP6_004133 [Peronosclerospora sorghi]|uniref:Uncharacterized protein n=1 Tax=Peronosclerospora sorghi TaxID=230839 RepID=A0ACC0VJB9_9STRA|nr:hypothetical protein PsorP6_004133 [Peronosclerospora sorghi]
MCDPFLGSPASPLESLQGPGQEEDVRNSPPRDVADDVPPLPSPLPEPLVTPGQKSKAPPGGTTKDKHKAPTSLQNASMRPRQNFSTALKEASQEKALATREEDDKRLQWEKEKWEDEKRKSEREKEEREATWAAEREEREAMVVEREERSRMLELEERELELRKKDAEKEIVLAALKQGKSAEEIEKILNLLRC